MGARATFVFKFECRCREGRRRGANRVRETRRTVHTYSDTTMLVTAAWVAQQIGNNVILKFRIELHNFHRDFTLSFH